MMMMMMINMLSFLLQARASESEEATVGRLAQDRDRHSEVRDMLMFLVMTNMLRSLMMMMMMLKTINMFSLPVQVRADESTEAREARLAQDRIQTAKVKHVNVVDAGDVHGHVDDDDVVNADPGMGDSV